MLKVLVSRYLLHFRWCGAAHAMEEERDVTELDQFLLHIHSDPGKYDDVRKHTDLWCNNKKRKSVKRPVVSFIKAKRFKATNIPFS